jgi:hypothetical protein
MHGGTVKFLEMFGKCSGIKFRENASCGSRVVPRGQTVGRTDKMKLIVAFRNYSNAPKNRVRSSLHVLYSAPYIMSVIKPRMMMWVGLCGTHVCVWKTSKYTMLLHLEDTATPGTDTSAWRGNASETKSSICLHFQSCGFVKEKLDVGRSFFIVPFYSSSEFYLFK